MITKTLGRQITALIAQLLLLTTVAVLSVVWWSVTLHAQKQVSQNLDVGINVFGTLLANREQRLINSSAVLTADFGFRQAVASGDTDTIESAIQNQAARINADLMAIVALDGNIVSVTNRALIEQQLLTTALIEQVLVDRQASTMMVIDEAIYQTLLITIDAPLPIAIAAIGFKLDQELAEELKGVTNLDVSFIAGNNIVSTMPETIRPTLFTAVQDSTEESQQSWWQRMTIGGGMKSRGYDLYTDNAISIKAYLTDDVDQVLAEFNAMQIEIGLISMLSISAALALGIIFSRSLTRPLDVLVKAAKNIARGDYSVAVNSESPTIEIGALSEAMKTMQEGIREREAEITYQATHDSLTGLLNRSEMLRLIDEKVSSEREFSLVAINFIKFRSVNDMFGHSIGDRCLALVASRLNAFDTVSARIGGAIFLVLVEGAAATEKIAALKDGLENPYELESLSIKLVANLGVIEFPRQADSGASLVRRVEIAVDFADNTASRIHLYQEGQEEDYIYRLQLVDELRKTLDSQQTGLNMHYQPKLDIKRHRVTRCEALIRWNHPQLGFIPPDIFIPLAEKSGLINPLTEWVIEQVIEQIARWRQHAITLQVAINLSAQDISRPELLPFVLERISRAGISTDDLAFEVTESELMEDPALAIELLENYKNQGFDLAIDDFGTGYSSLSQLKNMPVTELKIDREFVMDLANQVEDQTIVRSTIELGHSFDMAIVAEGVENEESFLLLSQWGCEWMQGYWLAKPMPGEAIRDWLKTFEENR